MITPLDGIIQFSSSAGAGTGQVKVDGDDLVISNLVGDVLLGDGASDVFIGNGSDNVDIVFEQNGEIRDDGAADEVNKTSTTAQDIGRGKGFYQEAQYTNSSKGAFEEKTLTIQPQKDGYYLNYGVKTTSTNIREEPFKMREPVVRFSKGGFTETLLDRQTNKRAVVRSNFNVIKKRISGRI